MNEVLVFEDIKGDVAVNSMIEVWLPEGEEGNTDDAFLKIRETLSRIGINFRKDGVNTLYQTCHILKKRGKYYITHFKLLFALDGRDNTMIEKDLARMNKIALLLEEWNMLKIDPESKVLITEELIAPMSSLKVVKFSEKKDWKLEAKYSIGKYMKKREE